MTELKDILAIYDDVNKKGFECYDVSADIRKLPDSSVSLFDAQSEILAMMFQDGGGKGDWNTYYGPMMSGTRTNKETGETEPAYNPDYRWITQEHLNYWLERGGETHNPFMRMRYLGLICDFQKKITGKEVDYKTVKVPYVQSIIKVVVEGYYQYDVIGILYAERALQCATSWRNKELIDASKRALFILNQKTKDMDDSPGIWCKCFDLMLRYYTYFTDSEIQILVDEAESRFNRIEESTMAEGRTTDTHAHHMKDQAEVLCKYYVKVGDTAKIENILDRVCAAIRLAGDARGGMWLHGMLGQMQSMYRRFHMEKKANRLYIDIQQAGKNTLQELQKYEVPCSIDKELMDKYISDSLSGTNEEVIQRYITSYIPNLALEKQRQLEESKRSAFLDLVTTTIYDVMGNPINHLGVGKDAEHQKFMYGMHTRMMFSAVFMRIIVKKMIENNILTFESVMQAFEGSVIINDMQRPLFERGIKAYFEEDYIVACHLLIPMFESSIRMLVASLGDEILRTDKNPIDGNQYISLDGLFRSEVMKGVFPEDVIVYFENLFTDHNGWNLRNQISHGLLSADSFNATMADRIVHAFMVLSKVKVTN